jgi:hypothetical protein
MRRARALGEQPQHPAVLLIQRVPVYRVSALDLPDLRVEASGQPQKGAFQVFDSEVVQIERELGLTHILQELNALPAMAHTKNGRRASSDDKSVSQAGPSGLSRTITVC